MCDYSIDIGINTWYKDILIQGGTMKSISTLPKYLRDSWKKGEPVVRPYLDQIIETLEKEFSDCVFKVFYTYSVMMFFYVPITEFVVVRVVPKKIKIFGLTLFSYTLYKRIVEVSLSDTKEVVGDILSKKYEKCFDGANYFNIFVKEPLSRSIYDY
ncbi:MAG: hypothetical protein PHH83_04045 [Patescibacteria group bacterium]|nr:hypothetical protein [Patescibacteria group bacterium]